MRGKPKQIIEMVVKDPQRTILGTVQLVLDERAMEIVGGENGAAKLRQLFEVAWVGGVGMPLVLHSRTFPANGNPPGNPFMDVAGVIPMKLRKRKRRKR